MSNKTKVISYYICHPARVTEQTKKAYMFGHEIVC